MDDECRFGSATACWVHERSRVRPGGQVGNAGGVVRVLIRSAIADGQAHQVDVNLGEAVRRVEKVGDGDTTQSVSRRHPDTNIDGLGDIVAPYAYVERTADTALQLSHSRSLVPAPTSAALSRLGVERKGSLDTSDRILITEGDAEAAGFKTRFWAAVFLHTLGAAAESDLELHGPIFPRYGATLAIASVAMHSTTVRVGDMGNDPQ